MEFAASKLACGEDKPVMLIGSPLAENDEGLEFFQPCDIVKLATSQGMFTQEADRVKTSATIATMLNAKLDAYQASGNYTLMRLLLVFAPVFLPKADFAEANALKKGKVPLGAIDRLKKRVRWRDDVAEAAWATASGWSLLTLAAALDDLEAVQALLKRPDAPAMLRARGKPHNVPGHETFNKILHDYSTNMTALVAAATLGSVPVIEALLDAGASMRQDAWCIFGEDGCHLRGCVLAGQVDNTRYLLTRFPQYINSPPHPPMGFNVLCLALFSGFNQHEMVEMLIELGADVSSRQNPMGVNVIQFAAMQFDVDARVIHTLKQAGADMTSRYRHGRNPMFAVMPTLLSLASRLTGSPKLTAMASGFRKIAAAFLDFHGGTPLHAAAKRADYEMVKALMAAGGCDASALDARGRTALGLIKENKGAESMAAKLFEKALGPDPISPTHASERRQASRWPLLLLSGGAIVGGAALLLARRRR